MKRFRLLLLSLLIGSYTLGAQTLKEEQPLKPIPDRISLRIKPLSYIFGGHIGIEKPLSPRLSWVNDLVVHAYFGRTAALSSSLQWYLTKEPTRKDRWHLRFEAVGGFFWQKEPIVTERYYAGLGGFGGFSSRIKPKLRFYAEAGLRYAPPFGKIEHDKDKKIDGGGVAYYTLISPGSLAEVNVGLSFDL